MNMFINQAINWFDAHPKIKQWLWFIGLWCGGLSTVLAFSYLIKWMMH